MSPSQKNDDERQRLIERLRKILSVALDKETSPAIAETALRKADELMQRTGIRPEDVSPEDLHLNYAPCLLTNSQTPAAYIQSLASVISISFGTVPFVATIGNTDSQNQTVIAFVGRTDRVDISCYTWLFLARRLKVARSRYISNVKKMFEHRTGGDPSRLGRYLEGSKNRPFSITVES